MGFILYRQIINNIPYEFLAYCDCSLGNRYNCTNEKQGESKGINKRQTLSIHVVFSPWEIEDFKKSNNKAEYPQSQNNSMSGGFKSVLRNSGSTA
jgi:hypothetical protein